MVTTSMPNVYAPIIYPENEVSAPTYADLLALVTVNSDSGTAAIITTPTWIPESAVFTILAPVTGNLEYVSADSALIIHGDRQYDRIKKKLPDTVNTPAIWRIEPVETASIFG